MDIVTAVLDDYLEEFRRSLRIRGYVIEESKTKSLNCMNCKDKKFSVKSKLQTRYSVTGKTITITEENIKDINVILNLMRDDEHL